MVNSNNVTRKFTMKEKLASLGPGFVIVGSFIGPGTVTSCTLAGATYGFTLFWCVVFSVIAVIVMQGMAARIGIITQEGLAENMTLQTVRFFETFYVALSSSRSPSADSHIWAVTLPERQWEPAH